MATMTTRRRPASRTIHGGETIFQQETPAFTRLKQLQIRHLPIIVRMLPKPSSEERGRAFQKRRGLRSCTKQAQWSKLDKNMEKSPAVALSAYPPYVTIPGLIYDNRKYNGLTDMVEGATCRLVLQLSGEGKSWKEIIDYLHRTRLEPEQRHRFGVNDIRTIITRCKSLGLTAYSVLESEDWDLEMVDKWWIEEDKKCFDLPVTDICGSSCCTGWFNELKSRSRRDWARWPTPEIGPQHKLSFEEDF